MKLKLIIYTLNKKKRKTLKRSNSEGMFAIQTGCTNKVKQGGFPAEVLRAFARKKKEKKFHHLI